MKPFRDENIPFVGYQIGEYWPSKGIFHGKDKDGNEIWE